MKSNATIANWMPWRFSKQNNDALNCEWIYLSNNRFVQPFFDETIQHCRSHPYNSSGYKVITSIADMADLAQDLPGIEPTAFVFHTSRCGSTLMMQLLSLSPQNIVVSEHPFLDQLLRLPFQIMDLQQSKQEYWVKAFIRLLGQIRFPQEEKLIIKLDSWHLSFFDQIDSWYPNVPKVILYREPLASIGSLLHEPGLQAVPNLLEPVLFGLDEALVAQMDQLEYLNQVFAAMYTQIKGILYQYPNVLTLDYGEGVENMFERLLKSLALKPDIDTQQRLITRMGYHSKRQAEAFKEKTARDLLVSANCKDAYWQLTHGTH